jgi:hypothetical protein
MSRYNCVLDFPLTANNLPAQIETTLASQHLDLVFKGGQEYWVAREPAGTASLPHLVTVEVLLASPRNDLWQITCIAQNVALPLQRVNHCFEIFDRLQKALGQLRQAEVLAAGGSHRLH